MVFATSPLNMNMCNIDTGGIGIMPTTKATMAIE
jgi:hypothetical protein